MNGTENIENSSSDKAIESSTSLATRDDYYTDVTVYTPESNEERYYELFDKDKPKTQAWSVASLVIGILSVLLSFLGWWALALGVASAVLAAVSRRVLGYFSGICIVGMIIGIFGTVISASVAIAGIILSTGVPVALAVFEI